MAELATSTLHSGQQSSGLRSHRSSRIPSIAARDRGQIGPSTEVDEQVLLESDFLQRKARRNTKTHPEIDTAKKDRSRLGPPAPIGSGLLTGVVASSLGTDSAGSKRVQQRTGLADRVCSVTHEPTEKGTTARKYAGLGGADAAAGAHGACTAPAPVAIWVRSYEPNKNPEPRTQHGRALRTAERLCHGPRLMARTASDKC